MRSNLNNGAFAPNGYFSLKNQDWLDKQRIAGKIAAKTLILLKNRMGNNKGEIVGKCCYTLSELNIMAEEYITSQGGIPTFKGYKGFPAGVCMSVNKQLVHGIPNDYKLNEGDLISFDLGVTVDGVIADTAMTCIFGEPKSEQHVRLIKATEEALTKAISSIKVGNRLGHIGDAISKCAKEYKFGVVTEYGGHGLDYNTPHAAPFVANKATLDEGIRIQSGLTIAIEPMFTIGSPMTKVLNDGWTVVTNDISAHFEHTVFVHEDHIEIITDRNL